MLRPPELEPPVAEEDGELAVEDVVEPVFPVVKMELSLVPAVAWTDARVLVAVLPTLAALPVATGKMAEPTAREDVAVAFSA